MASYNITGKVDLQPLKKAAKAFEKFDKQTSLWAKHSKKAYAAVSTAASYYAQKVLRESIKNALDDEKSQRVLALTLSNVAGATDAAVTATEQQIAAMQSAYGVTDDLLRPALARLARSSGSASQAAYDLNLALDISAATGKSLEAVTGALGKALDGNYASLQRLGLGIDSSILKTKDQNKIFGQLRTTFRNFAANEAATTEGKFRRIGVAADEAKEIIGVALIDSINNMVATQGGVEGLTNAFNDLAYAIADTLRGLGQFSNQVGEITKRFNIDLVQAIPVLGGWLKGFQAVGKQQRINLSLQTALTRQVISARNAEYMALKAKKEATDQVTDGTKKTVEQLMAEEAARKAGFKITEDIDSIQTVAAAKRLEESRQYKASVIDAAQAQYDALKRNYDALDNAWKLQTAAFQTFKDLLAAGLTIPVAMQISGFTSAAAPANAAAPTVVPQPTKTPFMGNMTQEAMVAPANVIPTPTPMEPAWMSELPQVAGGFGDRTIVNVTVNAGAVGSEQYLADVINNAIVQNTRNGISQFPAGFVT